MGGCRAGRAPCFFATRRTGAQKREVYAAWVDIAPRWVYTAVKGKGGFCMDQARVGRFIAACRRERGLTQRQLAEQLLVSDKTVSKWETGGSLR